MNYRNKNPLTHVRYSKQYMISVFCIQHIARFLKAMYVSTSGNFRGISFKVHNRYTSTWLFYLKLSFASKIKGKIPVNIRTEVVLKMYLTLVECRLKFDRNWLKFNRDRVEVEFNSWVKLNHSTCPNAYMPPTVTHVDAVALKTC